MNPCGKRSVRVRAHKRDLESGKKTHVRAHTRDVKGKARGREVYNKVERFYKKKGYSHERSEQIAGAVAYGPHEESE